MHNYDKFITLSIWVLTYLLEQTVKSTVNFIHV